MLGVIGTVLQDVVADAMSTEVTICEQALAYRRSIAGLLQIAIENAIIPRPALRFSSRVLRLKSENLFVVKRLGHFVCS
jgi:hypothetical protein